MPPLRERRDDIIELAEYFLERHRDIQPLRLSQAAADALRVPLAGQRARAAAGDGACGRARRRLILDLDDLPPALLDGYTDILVPALETKKTMRAWGSRYAEVGAGTVQQ